MLTSPSDGDMISLPPAPEGAGGMGLQFRFMNWLVSLWVNLSYGEVVSPLVFLHNASAVPTYRLSGSVDSDARYSVRVVSKKLLATKAGSCYDCVSHVFTPSCLSTLIN